MQKHQCFINNFWSQKKKPTQPHNLLFFVCVCLFKLLIAITVWEDISVEKTASEATFQITIIAFLLILKVRDKNTNCNMDSSFLWTQVFLDY